MLADGSGGAPATEPFSVLVLSGGGAFGAYEAGVLSALSQELEYDVVCGTSIGALNGAMYATGQVSRLTKLWASISTRNVVALPQAVQPNTSTALLARLFTVPHRWLQAALGKVQGVYSAEPVRDIIRSVLITADGTAIVPFQKPFFWAVTDLSDLCGTYYYQEPARPQVGAETVRAALAERGIGLRTIATSQPRAFVEALRASTAIPAFFEPATLGDKVFVDGGVVNNTPFDVAKIARRLFGAGRPLEIHTVFNDPREHSLSAPETRNALAILFSCYELMQKRLVDDAARLTVREAELARRVRPAEGALAQDQRLRDAADVTIRVVRPTRALNGSVFDFRDQRAIDENFALGQRDGAAGWQPYGIPPDFCALGPA